MNLNDFIMANEVTIRPGFFFGVFAVMAVWEVLAPKRVLTVLIKFATIVVLGPPLVAVVIFEVVLNATAMFNHGNIALPKGLDRVLRWFVVTPDMHRVHHSVEDDEANSNFGFSLPWWDRLFGTYRDQPRAGHRGMTIGIHTYRTTKQVSWLPGMLALPFIGKVSGYAINRRSWGDRDE
jgi:sterol desaturase/sphingolipid hydroxylase (fatty acid hydroxylase superfamily)